MTAPAADIFTPADALMMCRALQLARNGELHASPNPMVGAVIAAPDGRIIGEGWHRRCGEGHAEVNAVASVSDADLHLLPQSRMYVTLEPCCHYGKTPPCAKLIIDRGIPEVIVATLDPFAKVAGRGVEMLRDAGVKVRTGLLEHEAVALNEKFMTAHTLHRPFITLKWARSADGFIDGRDEADGTPARISDQAGSAECHKLRATHDAILIGSGTFLADHPTLTVRNFAGENPARFVIDRRGRISPTPAGWSGSRAASLREFAEELYRNGITSLLVEGGRRMLQSFIDEKLFDAIHIETNPSLFLGQRRFTTPAPAATIGRHAEFAHQD